MASLQIDGGYTRVPNELLEASNKTRMTDAERRVFFSIIRLTYGFGRTEGRISIRKLVEETELPKRKVISALHSLEGRGMIEIERKENPGRGHVNVIRIQGDHRKWEKCAPSVTLFDAEKCDSTGTLYGGKSVPHGAPIKEKYNKNIYTRIFDFWNSQGIIRHRSLSDKVKRAINGRLREGYTVEEITEAIQNYSTILKGEEFFWWYRWTLWEFLQRGLDRFTNEARPLENFRRDKPTRCRNIDLPYPRSKMAEDTLRSCGCPACLEELRRREDV